MAIEFSQNDVLHRIKNHLSVILGFAELALDVRDLPDGVRSDLGEIKKAAQSALSELPRLEVASDE